MRELQLKILLFKDLLQAVNLQLRSSWIEVAMVFMYLEENESAFENHS